MNLPTLPTLIPDFTVSQLTALPPAQLQEGYVSLQALQTVVKQALDRMNAALEIRYGERAREARLATGKDFGVVHLDDEGVRVTVDSPKRVSWNQSLLAETAQRIAASEERVEDYLDIEFSIPESRFNNWPPLLRGQFEAARTVKPGKSSFRLAMIDENKPEEER